MTTTSALSANSTLRRLRQQRGWSQAMLAQRLDTSVQNVGYWERGRTCPSPYFRTKLCELFELDAEALGLLEPALIAAPQTAIAAPVLSRQEPILDPMRPRFSIPITQVIGRHGLLDGLFALLHSGTSCVLYGLPGVGKTTLAQLLSQDARCQQLFPDGLLWVSLGPQPDVHTELLRLTALLQAPEDQRRQARSTQELAHYVRHLIGERQLLLVIDDAWRVEEARGLLLGAPQMACLITTRLPEVAMTLSEAQPIAVPELDGEQSYRLLTQLAPQLAQSPPKTVQQVLQYTGGLPLALTVLGSYLRMQSIGGQRRRIETALAQLSDASLRLSLLSPQRTAMQRLLQPEAMPESLATIVGISEQHLLPAVRQALRALSLLPAKPESFSEEAALAVGGHGLDILDELLDAGLVEGAGEGRYSMHQVIADYARLYQQDEAPVQRLIQYARQVCLAFNVKQVQSIQEVEREYPLVLSALQLAIARQQHTEVIQIILALAPLWRIQGWYEQADRLLQAALAGTTTQAAEYAQLLALRAWFAIQREAWEQAEQDALHCLELRVSAAQPEVRATCLLTLGRVAHRKSLNIQARTYYEQGLQLARSSTNHESTCLLLHSLGVFVMQQGDYHQAEVLFQEALELARQNEQMELMCEILVNLGQTLQLAGAYAAAEEQLQEGLALARRLRYRNQQTGLLLNLGVTFCLQGEYARGKALHQEGLELARQLENRRKIKWFLLNLGDVAVEEEAHEEAERYFLEGLAEARQSKDMAGCILAFTNLGTNCARRGAWQEAQTNFEEAVMLARDRGDPWLLSNALCCRGEASLTAQQVDAAEEWFQEALAVYQDREPNRELVTLAQFGLAQVAARRGRQEEARQAAEQCLLVLVEMNHRSAQQVQAWLDQPPLTTAGSQHQQEQEQEHGAGPQQAAQETQEVVQRWSTRWSRKRVSICPRCHSSQQVHKRGKSRIGAQRYQCLHCQHAFTLSSKHTVVTPNPLLQDQARALAAQGLGVRAIARQLGVSHQTVLRWLRAISEPPPPA